jgi:hypothetical protein
MNPQRLRKEPVAPAPHIQQNESRGQDQNQADGGSNAWVKSTEA